MKRILLTLAMFAIAGVAGAQTVSESASAPTPGIYDIYQLSDTSSTPGSGPGGNNNLNYYDNNSISASSGASGQSFTTGNNASGYVLTALSYKVGFNGGATGGNNGVTSDSYRVMVYQLWDGINLTDANSVTYPTNIYQVVASNVTATAPFTVQPPVGDWVTISGLVVPLQPNTTYAYTVCDVNTSWYDALDYTDGAVYEGPAIAGQQSAGIGTILRARVPTITQGSGAPNTGLASGSHTNFDYWNVAPGAFLLGGAATSTTLQAITYAATFDLSLVLPGPPIFSAATATVNPVDALSTTETVSAGVPLPGTNPTYQWQTNSDLTGGLGGTWGNVLNATNPSLPFVPPNLNPSTTPNSTVYTLDFQLTGVNSTGLSATSAVLALVVSNAIAPQISFYPGAVTLYAGGSVTFVQTSFSGTLPITNVWYYSVPPSSTLIPLATNVGANLNLAISNVTTTTNFYLISSNNVGSTSSGPIPVTVVPLPSDPKSFAATVLSAGYGATAFWPLNETTTQPSPGPAYAYDYIGGFTGVYGTLTQNGASSPPVVGPSPPGQTGFPASPDGALEPGPVTSLGTTGTVVTSATPAAATGNTNATILIWINPTSPNTVDYNGIIYARSGSTTGGISYDPSGSYMGYQWGGNSFTYSYSSGLPIPVGVWSMLALVVTQTNTTFWVCNTNVGISVNQQSGIANSREAFGVPINIGGDPNENAGRYFQGYLADAVLFSNALTTNQITALFSAGLGDGTIPPLISTQPSPVVAVASGRPATLAVAASVVGTATYQWYVVTGSPGSLATNPVVNGTGISGATNSTLVLSNAANNVGTYYVKITDTLGSATSGESVVSSVSPTPVYGGSTYAQAITNLNPVAFYRLSQGDVNNYPATSYAYDYWGGYTGIYGTNVGIGVPGPTVPGTFVDGGFEFNNTGAEFTNSIDQADNGNVVVAPDSEIVVPPLNLNTNAVTITMWVNPNEEQLNSTGLFYSQGDGTVAGLGFDTSGLGDLGYEWNNVSVSGSGLNVPPNTWSFVALTIASNTATLYCYNANSQQEKLYTGLANATQTFGAVSAIGNNPLNATGGLQFDGSIDDVAIFNKALTGNQIDSLFTIGSGIPVPASIIVQPTAPQYVNVGASNVTFTVVATNGTSLFYTWTANANLLTNGANGYPGTLFSGATTGILTISNYPSAASGFGGQSLVVSVTNSQATPTTIPASAAVTAPQVFPVPAVWTANFCFTNAGNWEYNASPANIPTGYTGNYGLIGEGTFWNALISPGNETTGEGGEGDSFPYLLFTNNTSLDITGTINTGIGASIQGQPYASGIALPYHNELLDIFVQTFGSPIAGVCQPGFYTFIFYCMDGTFNSSPNSGETYTLDGISQSINNNLNSANDYTFELGQNCCILTNVYINNTSYSVATATVGNISDFNGLQIQQVMPISLSAVQSDATHVTVTYSGGTLYSTAAVPNAPGPPTTWTAVAGAPLYSGSVVIPVVQGSAQFYELVIGDGYPIGGGN